MRVIHFVSGYWCGNVGFAQVLSVLIFACVIFPFFPTESTAPVRYSQAAVMLLVCGVVSIGAIRTSLRMQQERPGNLSVWVIYGLILSLWVLTVNQVASLFLPASNVIVPVDDRPPKVVLKGQDIWISGDIDYRTLTELRVFLESATPPVTIWLHSTGGNVIAGRSIGLAIERAGMDTGVDQKCYSACTLVFAGGQRRRLPKGAMLGFHGYRFDMPMRVQTLSRDEIEAKDRIFLARRGVAPAFLDRVYQVAPEDIWIPTRAELLRAGVITP